jgi:hypothetical protein
MRLLPTLTPVLLRRFLAKVEHGPTVDDCSTWTGAIQSRGYGSFGFGARGHVRTYLAHRLAHHWFVGPIPDGLQIDHVCHNLDLTCAGGRACVHRRCVNPTHLEPVTGGQNIWRSGGWGRLFLLEVAS